MTERRTILTGAMTIAAGMFAATKLAFAQQPSDAARGQPAAPATPPLGQKGLADTRSDAQGAIARHQ
jgi:hypothetical protein